MKKIFKHGGFQDGWYYFNNDVKKPFFLKDDKVVAFINRHREFIIKELKIGGHWINEPISPITDLKNVLYFVPSFFHKEINIFTSGNIINNTMIKLDSLSIDWYILDAFPNKPFFVCEGEVKYHINEIGEFQNGSINLSGNILKGGITKLAYVEILGYLKFSEKKKFYYIFGRDLNEYNKIISYLSRKSNIESEEEINPILVKQQKAIV